MEPFAELPYSEFAVVEELSRDLKKDKFSAFVPLSRQQRSVDFLIHNQVTKKCARFQVKASRSFEVNSKGPYEYNLLFKNFIEKCSEGACDFYCLFGLYPDYDNSKRITDGCKQKMSTTDTKRVWRRLVLCFPARDMEKFLQNVKTKNDPNKPDKFFYISLGGIGPKQPSIVHATRGFNPARPVSEFLLASKIGEIEKFLS